MREEEVDGELLAHDLKVILAANEREPDAGTQFSSLPYTLARPAHAMCPHHNDHTSGDVQGTGAAPSVAVRFSFFILY
jgi:hypothetical protein